MCCFCPCSPCHNYYNPRHPTYPPPPPQTPSKKPQRPILPRPIPEENLKPNNLDIVLQPLWKLTLPSKNPKNPSRPKEIKFPELKYYSDEHFFLKDNALHLKVPTTGATTPNSKYPRCEFRELNEDGSLASWSTESGFHSMTVIASVKKVAKNKPHVCIAQIHDSKDDVCMVRYEDGKMIVSGNHFTKFQLGTVELDDHIDITFECKEGDIRVFCNNFSKSLPKISASGCYFKAGNYLQSNKSHDKSDEGIVVLKRLVVDHRY